MQSSLEHIPLSGQDAALAAESLTLTPEARAELDETFGNIVESLEETVSVSEREQSAKMMDDKVNGSFEPGLKKPK